MEGKPPGWRYVWDAGTVCPNCLTSTDEWVGRTEQTLDAAFAAHLADCKQNNRAPDPHDLTSLALNTLAELDQTLKFRACHPDILRALNLARAEASWARDVVSDL